VRRAYRAQPIPKAERGRLFLYALLGVSFNQVLFILGLSMTTAIHTSILMSSIPVFTMVTAALLRHEALSARGVAGIVLAGTGALLLLSSRGFDWQSRYFRGDLLLLANCLSYSLFLVLSRPILARCEPLTFVTAIFRYGAIPIVLVSLPAFGHFSPASVTPTAWVSLAAIVLFSTTISRTLSRGMSPTTRGSDSRSLKTGITIATEISPVKAAAGAGDGPAAASRRARRR